MKFLEIEFLNGMTTERGVELGIIKPEEVQDETVAYIKIERPQVPYLLVDEDEGVVHIHNDHQTFILTDDDGIHEWIGADTIEYKQVKGEVRFRIEAIANGFRRKSIDHDEFQAMLAKIMDEKPASHWLTVTGIYEVMAEELNNEIIDRISEGN